MNAEEKSSRFQVFIRVRPRIAEDYKENIDEENYDCVSLEKNNPTVLHLFSKKNFDEKSFLFDHVFDHTATQEMIHKKVSEPIIEEVCNGFNGTILAFGQTGSGKTFTIFGTKKTLESLENNILPKDGGVVFRALKQLFDYIHTNMEKRQFQVTISFMELYLENILDLLADISKKQKEPLQIREDPQTGVYVNGLTQKSVRSLPELMALIKVGVKSRISASTTMNKNSSRSHALLQVFLEQRWVESEIQEGSLESGRGKSTPPQIKKKHHKKALLTLVDLAGSERVSKSYSDGLRLEEAKTINKSISALGNCIAALANENQKKFKWLLAQSHIPFRDSKLTRLLSESLSGFSKTNICACIGPSLKNFEETYSTVLFASRAMTIRIDPKLNEEIFIKVLGDNTSSVNTTHNLIQNIPNSLDCSNIENSRRENLRLKEEIDHLKKQIQESNISNSFVNSNNHSFIINRDFSANQFDANPSDFSSFPNHQRTYSATSSSYLKQRAEFERPILIRDQKDGYYQEKYFELLWEKRERELVEKYTGLIEHLQEQLAKKEILIENLKKNQKLQF